MTTGLPVSRFITSSVNLTPSAAVANDVNTALILGDSSVIDTLDRFRSYSALSDIATDFGTSAAEYLAAQKFFGQVPQPNNVLVGRWAQGASSGILKCGVMTPTQQALSNFTSLTSSGFKIQVDGAGSAVAVSVGTLAAAGNLNAVATAINTGLATATVGATCAWVAAQNRFVFTSTTTGTSSKVRLLVAPASGNDLATLILGETGQGAVEVDGIAAESITAGLAAVEAAAPYFYGLCLGTAHAPSDAEQLAVAAYVQASAANHFFTYTTQDVSHLTAGSTTNLGYSMDLAGYTRSAGQYSASSQYAAASLLGRMITVDYTATNSTITLAFKAEPGVTAEVLTTAQANALDSYRLNYLAKLNNGSIIIANGWCSGPAYIDEIAGLDALAGLVQANIFDLLVTLPKVPQTDPGVNQLLGATNQAGAQFVTNGFLAPGVWSGPPMGALNTGDTLTAGYLSFATPIAQQSSGDRAARKSPALQMAVKLAGAVQSASAIINVNR